MLKRVVKNPRRLISIGSRGLLDWFSNCSCIIGKLMGTCLNSETDLGLRCLSLVFGAIVEVSSDEQLVYTIFFIGCVFVDGGMFPNIARLMAWFSFRIVFK